MEVRAGQDDTCPGHTEKVHDAEWGYVEYPASLLWAPGDHKLVVSSDLQMAVLC